jgi:hypothetical protein
MTAERLAEIVSHYAKIEPYRAACESRYVAGLTDVQCTAYLDGVLQKRGKEAATKLRQAWAETKLEQDEARARPAV